MFKDLNKRNDLFFESLVGAFLTLVFDSGKGDGVCVSLNLWLPFSFSYNHWSIPVFPTSWISSDNFYLRKHLLDLDQGFFTFLFFSIHGPIWQLMKSIGPLLRIIFFLNVLPGIWFLLWVESHDFLCLSANNVCGFFFLPWLCLWCSHNVIFHMLNILME